MKRFAMVVLAGVLVFGGAACSDDTQDAQDAAGDLADEAEDVAREGADRAEDVVNDQTVNIDNNAYEPENVEVSVGQEVTWVNQDDAEHTVTSDTKDAFESDQLGEGDEFSERFTEAGEYTYHCEVHGKDAMSGTVTVTD
jgi:plastocyanin